MSERTRGRLHYHDAEAFTLCDEDGGAVAITEARKRSTEENDANAYHFIACWNACEDAGIENPAAIPKLIREVERAIEGMETTRMILQNREKEARGWTDEAIRKWANWGALDTTGLRSALAALRGDK